MIRGRLARLERLAAARARPQPPTAEESRADVLAFLDYLAGPWGTPVPRSLRARRPSDPATEQAARDAVLAFLASDGAKPEGSAA